MVVHSELKNSLETGFGKCYAFKCIHCLILFCFPSFSCYWARTVGPVYRIGSAVYANEPGVLFSAKRNARASYYVPKLTLFSFREGYNYKDMSSFPFMLIN